MGSKQSLITNEPTADSSSNCSDSDVEEDSDEYLSLGSEMERSIEYNDITIDAANTVPPRPTFSYPTSDDIDLLDKNLDDYEKVSLVYLLYDNPTKACAVLENPLTTVVRNWFQREALTTEKWHIKLLEALCIIKNYQVLRLMGHTKADMLLTFSPYINVISLHVNVVRKALFCMFESLTQASVDRLILALLRDLSIKHINCYINRENLELTFLQLEKNNFMSLKDLRNVYNLLKTEDMLAEYEELKALHDKLNSFTTEQQQPSAATSWVRSSNTSFSNDESDNVHNVRHIDYSMNQNIIKPTECRDKLPKRVPDTTDFYHIDDAKPGLLLIINNEKFYTEYKKEFKALVPELSHKLENRVGTKADEDHLNKVFTSLKYKVVVETNVTHDKIQQVIKPCIKMVKDEDLSSFFVAILSHGDNGVIYGSNSVPVEIKVIQETLCAVSLCGKPKVLLIQACQGEKMQEIDEQYTTDGNEPLPQSPAKLESPKTSDVLVFYATIPNYSAIRHLQKGTWFIQSLCDKISRATEDHFVDICTKVIKDVSDKRWGNRVMVPLTTSTLTKKLYLTSKFVNLTFATDSTC